MQATYCLPAGATSHTQESVAGLKPTLFTAHKLASHTTTCHSSGTTALKALQASSMCTCCHCSKPTPTCMQCSELDPLPLHSGRIHSQRQNMRRKTRQVLAKKPVGSRPTSNSLIQGNAYSACMAFHTHSPNHNSQPLFSPPLLKPGQISSSVIYATLWVCCKCKPHTMPPANISAATGGFAGAAIHNPACTTNKSS